MPVGVMYHSPSRNRVVCSQRTDSFSTRIDDRLTTNARPRARKSPASEAMNGWTSKYCTSTPMSRPIAAPPRMIAGHDERGRVAGREQVGAEDAGERHHRADGEVDAAGDDDERHPHGQDQQVGVVEQQRRHVERGDEVAEVDLGADQQHDEDDERGERRHQRRVPVQEGPDVAARDDAPRRGGDARAHAGTSASGRAGGVGGPRAAGETARHAVHARRLDQHHEDHDDREEHRALRRGDPEEEDRRLERLDDEDADDGARDRELAAHQRGAAEHDGEDRVELDQVAGGVGVGRPDVGAVDDARDAGERAADDVGAEDDAARADAGQPARLGVDARPPR